MIEQARLIEPLVPFPIGPVFRPDHSFLNVRPSGYWSASMLAVPPTIAQVVVFGDGSVRTGNKTGSAGRVWCVRGAMNADGH